MLYKRCACITIMTVLRDDTEEPSTKQSPKKVTNPDDHKRTPSKRIRLAEGVDKSPTISAEMAPKQLSM